MNIIMLLSQRNGKSSLWLFLFVILDNFSHGCIIFISARGRKPDSGYPQGLLILSLRLCGQMQ